MNFISFLRIMDVLIQALIDTAIAYDHHATQGIPVVQNLCICSKTL